MVLELNIAHLKAPHREIHHTQRSRTLVENLGFQDPAGWVHNHQQHFVHLSDEARPVGQFWGAKIWSFPKFPKFPGQTGQTPLAALTLSLFVPLQNIFGRAVSPGGAKPQGPLGSLPQLARTKRRKTRHRTVNNSMSAAEISSA